MVQFWNPAYRCFTFGEVDVVPTLEEYTTLLRCLRIQGNKAYVRPASLPIFVRKLVMITGMSEQWAVARVQQKGDSKCIQAILRDLILTHPDVKKKNTPVLAILAETFKSLKYMSESCHFWKLKKVPCRVFFEGHSPLKEVATTPRRDDITEESFDWVPLSRIWGVVGYAPLLVLRKHKARQFR
ncbi:hypothetical protein CXB51_028868 [Gossypium anomalum]|uniref:DUF7745 domain-containing protein n=1 Tax=Gossypium anomalum TaxID=47600 RepID=A0A8J5XYQ8_9ROSI|nr:hypothetical protein CXB51_028868 [Gossypium anomalum]